MNSKNAKFLKIFSCCMLFIIMLMNLSSISSTFDFKRSLSKVDDQIPGFEQITTQNFYRYFELNKAGLAFDFLLFISGLALIIQTFLKNIKWGYICAQLVLFFCFGVVRSMMFVGLITGHDMWNYAYPKYVAFLPMDPFDNIMIAMRNFVIIWYDSHEIQVVESYVFFPLFLMALAPYTIAHFCSEYQYKSEDNKEQTHPQNEPLIES